MASRKPPTTARKLNIAIFALERISRVAGEGEQPWAYRIAAIQDIAARELEKLGRPDTLARLYTQQKIMFEELLVPRSLDDKT